jgi:hypothetical protein
VALVIGLAEGPLVPQLVGIVIGDGKPPATIIAILPVMVLGQPRAAYEPARSADFTGSSSAELSKRTAARCSAGG